MTKNYRMLWKLGLLFAALAFLAACGPGNYAQVEDEDIAGINDLVLSTYYMEVPADADAPRSIGAEDVQSRATVPVFTVGPLSFESGVVSYDYPEKGQLTEYSVVSLGSDLYRVTSVTTYPYNDAITDTTEVYFVKDIPTLGEWTNDDPVTTEEGVTDNLYRKTFETTYYDDTVRYYEIQEDSSTDDWTTGIHYAAFDLDGSLDFPEDGTFTPEEDGTANWSSRVSYFQPLSKKFSMWNRQYLVLVGTQYYTEHGDEDPEPTETPTKTFVAYERLVDLGGSVSGRSVKQLEKELWSDTTTLNLEDATLATTVIRYQIDPDGTKQVRMKTVVRNDYGDDFLFSADTADDPTPAIAPYAP